MQTVEKILFIGLPGSGKGTQAKSLEEKYGIVHLSTGELLRNSKDPEIIKIMSQTGDQGKFAPDDLILKLIEKNIPSGSYILDGAVRNPYQAKVVKEKDLIEKVLYFNISQTVCTRRMLKRGREDDTPESIEKRFREYTEKTKPAIMYLKENFPFYEINANRNPDEICRKVLKTLGLNGYSASKDTQ